MPDQPAISLTVEDLACIRGERDVFADVSFSAGPGEAVLLRGPNGAGKTSLLMCLAGYLPKEAGQISWSGLPEDIPASECLHVVGHLPAIKPALTLLENLSFWAELYGGEKGLISGALDQAGLSGLEDLSAATLSAGQTKRLALCRLLAAPRPVWLLDEPTSSLDKGGDDWVGALVSNHLTNGGTAIIATHRELKLAKSASVKTLEMEALSA